MAPEDTQPAGFVPFEALADDLLRRLPPQDDGSHDRLHLRRVWRIVRSLQQSEGGDLEVLLVATLLHDAYPAEKNAPDRAQASRRSADLATAILRDLGWSRARIALVVHAIEAHSHSAQIAPRSLEACILQDADRLDAIGAIGIARCFYTAGRIGSRLYDYDDPLAVRRALDDAMFALDHFSTKLLRIGASMTTAPGQAQAMQRLETMQRFVDAFLAEIGTAETRR